VEAQQLKEAAAELPTAEGQRAKDFVVRDGRDGWFATEAFSTAAGVWDRHGLYPGRLRQGLPQGQISACRAPDRNPAGDREPVFEATDDYVKRVLGQIKGHIALPKGPENGSLVQSQM
jgi:hypothetical protein